MNTILTRFRLPGPAIQVVGGLSGAAVWRVGPFALKAHPLAAADRLTSIHRWLQHALSHGCPLVPVAHAADDGSTVVRADGRAWELLGWRDGAPRLERDLSLIPPALAALRQLQTAWRDCEPSFGPAPAIARRLRAHAELSPTVFAPLPHRDLDRLRQALAARWASLPSLLQPWVARPVRLQMCWCDGRPAHVLFRGDVVSGLIDFASAKVDAPAVDVARLLGELLAPGHPAWPGLIAGTPDAELVEPLATTGRMIALAVTLSRSQEPRWASRARLLGSGWLADSP